MEGYEYRNRRAIIGENDSIGVIPRAIKSLFDSLSGLNFTVYCSYVQLYNENIYDLLNPAQLKKGLKLRWNKQEEFFLENLFLHPCYSSQEVMSHLHSGIKNKVIENQLYFKFDC